MREREPFVCDACRVETTIIRLISIGYIKMEICPKCHERMKDHYSELEVVGCEK